MPDSVKAELLGKNTTITVTARDYKDSFKSRADITEANAYELINDLINAIDEIKLRKITNMETDLKMKIERRSELNKELTQLSEDIDNLDRLRQTTIAEVDKFREQVVNIPTSFYKPKES